MPHALAFLPYLKVFEAVARLGSLRAAAEELNLSPSAVSLQLRRLSEVTELTLFRKVGRNVVLTAAGRDVFQATSQALLQLSTVVKGSREQGPLGTGRSLSISVPPALGIAWLSGLIIEHAESHHIVDVTINSAVAEGAVDWNATDLAIVYDNPPFPNRWWTLLSEVRLKTVCSPILFPQLDLQRRDRKLSGITLLHEDDGSEWAKWSEATRVDIKDSYTVRVPSIAHAVASAVQGRGIALASDVLTRGQLNDGRLIQPFATPIRAASAYYVVAIADPADDPFLQGLIGRINEYLRPIAL